MAWIILLISVFLFIYAFFKVKPEKEILFSSLIAGLVITFLNTICEWVCATLDVYYVKGPLLILKTPLPFFLSWIFLTSFYCTVFNFLPSGKIKVFLYALSGILAGWAFDYIMWRKGVLKIGEKGGPLIIACVWITAIPLALIIFSLFKNLIPSVKNPG